VGRFDRFGERRFENNLDAATALSVSSMIGTSEGGLIFAGAFNGIAQFGSDFLDSDGANTAYQARLLPQDPLAPGTLEFENAQVAVSEGVGAATVVVRRSGGADGTVRVRVRSFDRTAVAGEDYTAVDRVLEFEPGRLSRDFEVELIDDFRVEPEEALRLELSEFEGGAEPGTIVLAELRILNDDFAFEEWLDDFFEPDELTAPETADPDADGIPVLLEYAFGLDPLVSDTLPSQIAKALPGGSIRFVYQRHAARGDLRFTTLVSNDLQSWSAGTVLSESSEPLADERERVTLELDAPFDPAAKAFLRLEVERQTQQIGER
jgi:hypothetical protein